MKFKIIIGILIALLLSCVSKDDLLKFEKNRFMIFYPESIKVVVQKDSVDFIIYSFIYNDESMMNLYIGNQPSFDFEEDNNGTINNLPFISMTQKEFTGLISRNVIVHLYQTMSREEFNRRLSEAEDFEATVNEIMDSEVNWPHYAHFWYKDLDKEKALIADRIIVSINISAVE